VGGFGLLGKLGLGFALLALYTMHNMQVLVLTEHIKEWEGYCRKSRGSEERRSRDDEQYNNTSLISYSSQASPPSPTSHISTR
jgi:hypothetical protein